MTNASRSPRALLWPALAALVALGILLSLGTWQLQRLAWKGEIIERIQSRIHAEPVPLPPPDRWSGWTPEGDEYRRVQVTGRFRHDLEAPVHGLMAAGRGQPVQGFYVLTPLQLPDGSSVIVNRGFVPTELRDPATRAEGQVAGELTLTGLMRRPEEQGSFVPDDVPAANRWFTRNPARIAGAKGLDRVAPFLIDADATPNPGGWPRGGQTVVNLPNNHLQYAMTWFGIALTLVGVFATYAWRTLRPEGPAESGSDEAAQPRRS